MKTIKQLGKHFKEIDGNMWLVEKDRGNLKIDYKIKSIISSTKSPYQQVDIIELYDFGKCLVLDGVVQSTVLDGHIYNEMISHIPIVTHGSAKDVLIIGGGDCGVANEVLKYNGVERVDLVEIDEQVVNACIKHIPEIAGTTPDDSRVNFIFGDGVEFVKDKKNCYDVIIIDSSDPVGPAVQLFSDVFYTNVRNCLRGDGIMVCQSQSPVFNKDILGNVYSSLSELYPIVRIYKTVVPSYPGGMWSFTLASLKSDPIKADARGLRGNTSYLNDEIFKSCFSLSNMVKEIIG